MVNCKSGSKKILVGQTLQELLRLVCHRGAIWSGGVSGGGGSLQAGGQRAVGRAVVFSGCGVAGLQKPLKLLRSTHLQPTEEQC
jgi:hypothetical protein